VTTWNNRDNFFIELLWLFHVALLIPLGGVPQGCPLICRQFKRHGLTHHDLAALVDVDAGRRGDVGAHGLAQQVVVLRVHRVA